MSDDDRRDELVGKLHHIQNADWWPGQQSTGPAAGAVVMLAEALALASHGENLNVNNLSDADVDELIRRCNQLLAAHGRRWHAVDGGDDDDEEEES
jgi:hypothetical protein